VAWVVVSVVAEGSVVNYTTVAVAGIAAMPVDTMMVVVALASIEIVVGTVVVVAVGKTSVVPCEDTSEQLV